MYRSLRCIRSRLLPILCVSVLSACTDELPTVNLTVTVEGPGAIVSDPPGIDCGATCTAAFPLGTVVGLRARPQAGAMAVGVDAAFVNFKGALCSSANAQCFLTLAADATATGKFAAGPASSSSSCTDGQKNGSESDIDCGGSCKPCGLDAACLQNSDCSNGQCVKGLCSACPLDQNLLFNGDAESDVPGGSAPGWTFSSGFLVDFYGGGNLAVNDPGPAARGKNFFYGGFSGQSSATATVDLSKCSGLIERQAVTLKVSGFLGGFASQDDNMVVRFGIEQGASITKELTLGPVLAADRSNTSGLVLREASTLLPKGTCSLLVQMTATRTAGASNDAYADNLTAVVSLQ